MRGNEPIDFLRERNKRRLGAETPTAKRQQHIASKEHQQEICTNCGCPQDSAHEPINKELQLVSAATSQKHSLFVICKDQNDYFVRRRDGEVFLLSRSAFPEESLIVSGPAPSAPIAKPSTSKPGVPAPAPATPTPKKKELQCSCCERPQGKVRFLIDCERQNIYLCDGCIEICNEILRDEKISTDALPKPSERRSPSSYRSYSRTRYYCSLCGKEQEEVARLIAMRHDLYICNCCVGACNTAIAQGLVEAAANSPASVKEEIGAKR
jgi:hypothetical protein